jgi:hypothetical protein
MASLSVLALTLLSAAPSDFPTFEDKGDLFVKAGRQQGLQVGAEVELLGERIGDTEERRSLGVRTVMEVWNALARLSSGEGEKPVRAERARLAGKAAAPGKRAEARSNKAPARRSDSRAANTDPEAGKTSAVMSFNDHLSADCAGHEIDVFARSTLLGGVVTLQVDGAEAMSQEVFPGQSVVLSGKAGSATASVRVSQGVFGTD